MSSEAASVLTGRCKSRSARYLYKRTSIAARSRKAKRDERRRTPRCQGRTLSPHLWSRGPTRRCRPRPFERHQFFFEIAFRASWGRRGKR
eukprot:scaffold7795_cov38-Phaeocystis_antarctica.AAC.2